MIDAALASEINFLEHSAHELREILEKINDPTTFSLSQALCLTALIRSRKPDILIDLGTGNGNSAAIAAYAFETIQSAAKVHTFDIDRSWLEDAGPKLPDSIGTHVVSHKGDLTLFDFGPLLVHSKSAIVFWDAHGHEIAEKVLSEIMPKIWQLPHIVLCHDISDNRFQSREQRAYGNRPPWRGMNYYYRAEPTNYVNVGHFQTIVDQVIPIMDFCFRNSVDLQSCDYAVSLLATSLKDRFTRILQREGALTDIQMAYFSLQGQEWATFPRPRRNPMIGPPPESNDSKCLYSISSAGFGKLHRNFYGARAGCNDNFQLDSPSVANFETSKDHFATEFFDLPAASASQNDADELSLLIALEWSGPHIQHCEIVIQDQRFNQVTCFESETTPVVQRIVNVAPGSRIRLIMRAPIPGKCLLPSKLGVFLMD